MPVRAAGLGDALGLVIPGNGVAQNNPLALCRGHGAGFRFAARKVLCCAVLHSVLQYYAHQPPGFRFNCVWWYDVSYSRGIIGLCQPGGAAMATVHLNMYLR